MDVVFFSLGVLLALLVVHLVEDVFPAIAREMDQRTSRGREE